VIRADATAVMGTGHVMRCIALTQGWTDEAGGDVLLLSRHLPEALRTRCEGAGMITVEVTGNDVQCLLQTCERTQPAAVAVDGYHFDESYFRTLNSSKPPVLQIDDAAHRSLYTSTFVLNQNFHATPEMYANKLDGSHLLAGPDYALLRREFRRSEAGARVCGAVHNVLVLAGGSDPENHTSALLNMLAAVGGTFNVRVVLGASNVHGQDVRLAAAQLSGQTEVLCNVLDMSEQMAWADFAITAAGTSMLELAAMGVPFAAFSHGFGEELSLAAADRRGVGRSLGNGSDLTARRAELASSLRELLSSPETCRRMSRRGRELVDKNGPRRVVEALLG
jgi:UDP-2,4-diacetamido-2,4,6-trideoxy-beta-L-altropyranose hydrolase